MEKTYKIGTRTSPLALKQVEEVLSALKRFYPDIGVEIVGIDTYGDKDKTTPISEMEGSDFFTREIDKGLLKGDIDFAIHSAKDLPDILERDFSIAAITKSIDPFDVLVSKSGLKLGELPRGARIGTSSLRRKEALKRFRPDFQIVNIRGNIEERLSLLDRLDAIVIAAAGLIRLELEDRITQRLPFGILRPHAFQAALALVTRSEDLGLIRFLSKLDSREAIPV
ncbi:MAG: hydroxymethylbilane synthase [Candidatus Omnitrophota bacterium]